MVTLLDLPREIRDLIYLECELHLQISPPSPRVIDDPKYVDGRKVFPPTCQTKYPSLPLLTVNKQLRDEVLSLFPLLAHQGQVNFNLQILVKRDDFRPSWTFMTLGLPPTSRVNQLCLDIVLLDEHPEDFGPFLSERPVEMMSGLARFIIPFLQYGPSFLDTPNQYHMCFMDPFLYLRSSYSDARQDYHVQGPHPLETLLVTISSGSEFAPWLIRKGLEEFLYHLRKVTKLDCVAKLVGQVRVKAELIHRTGKAECLGEWGVTANDWDDRRSLRDGWIVDSNRG